MVSTVVSLSTRQNRHKFNASPQWACKECCAVSGRPSDAARKCQICGAINAVSYFDSRRELKRWAELRLLERAEKIRGLQFKPVFPLLINGRQLKTIRSYEAEAGYFEGERYVVEDSKGMRTREYRIKKELVELLYPGVTITEV